jgi:L-fucose isomerase
MGMETALQHIIPVRKAFGLEIARLDMKLLADMLVKKSYDAEELKALRAWMENMAGGRIEVPDAAAEERFTQSLAMYLITRDMMKSLNAVGGGFMSQLEWGSDRRGLPLPVADVMECLFNSTFDHNGRKNPLPYATEADTQALLTMLFFSSLSGGGAPLFMDFRKVWEPWEIQGVARELGVPFSANDEWAKRGFFDGNNSGSAAFDWAGEPGASPEELMKRTAFPLADPGYFPGGGNSATFITPGGIEGMLGRVAYHAPTQKFALVWDEAKTLFIPDALQEKIRKLTDPTWPHTWVSTKYGTMAEIKQYCPANHIHMVQGLSPARLEYFLDLAKIRSITPWASRPAYIEGVDRPKPVEMLLSGEL